MKWTYIMSVLVFEIGSAVCGAAPNMSALIVGRVIAGMGGSSDDHLRIARVVTLDAPLVLTVSSRWSGGVPRRPQLLLVLTAPTERGTYISLIGFCWGFGAVLGPVIGGAFSVSTATWRWAFYINLVIGAVAAPVFLLFLPPIHPIQGVTIRSRLADLDFLGFLLNAGVWVTFTLALTMAGGQWPWNDGRTIAAFVAFGALLAAYVAQQYFLLCTTRETKSFPAHLLRSPTQVLLFVATSASETTLFIIV